MTRPLDMAEAFSVPQTPKADLMKAIAEFENTLPGWWWTIGSCSVSRHASCGPDINGPDAALLEDRLFDEGFHEDDYEDGSTCAGALLCVMQQALVAKEARAR